MEPQKKRKKQKNQKKNRKNLRFTSPPLGPMRTMHSGHAHSFVITRCMPESEMFGRQSQFYNFF